MTTRTIDFVFRAGKTAYINVSDLSAPYDFVATCQVGSGVGSVSYEILVSDNLIDWESLGIETKSLTTVSLVNTRRIDKKYSYVALDVKSISGTDAKIKLAVTDDAYAYVATTWYAGEVSSVKAPVITADGDLSTATDQVPSYWRMVINAKDDVTAAQALLDGTPNVITFGLGEKKTITLDSSVISVYAVCVSTASSRPADFTGGAYIISGSGSTLADVLSNMAKFDFSMVSNVKYIDGFATPLYNTNYSGLAVAGGVIAS
jgi:hypothetical protein